MNWSDVTQQNREAVKLVRLYAQIVREQNPRIRAGLTDRLERKIAAYSSSPEMTGALAGVCYKLARRVSAKNGNPVTSTVNDLVEMARSVHPESPGPRPSALLSGMELLNALEAGENPAGLAHLMPRPEGGEVDREEDIRLGLDVATGLIARLGADPMRFG